MSQLRQSASQAREDSATAGPAAAAADRAAGPRTPSSPPRSTIAEAGSVLQTASELTVKDARAGSSHHPYSQEFFSEYFRRYELLIEFSNLPNPDHCPRGVYVMPTKDMNAWYGVIFVHSGYYKGGVFKFRMIIPPDYPANPPTVHFQTDMFHPLISNAQGPERGLLALDVRNRLYSRMLGAKMDPNDADGSGGHLDAVDSLSAAANSTLPTMFNRIPRVLVFIKQCFSENVLKRLTADDCLNKDAYDMYCTDHKVFTQLAQQCGQLSTTESSLYEHEPEGNPLQFDRLSGTEYEELRKRVLQEAGMEPGVANPRNMTRNVLRNLKSMGASGLNGIGRIL